ncbi:Gfo/Idh/MocA family protein [Haloarchaeobius sp. HRN-SO-5]|uniref:Gfo/Idh/MocA family protein n=1 Tax=Haloarchaeobius sp. HRN-SO-5 TaxID=3446118 RepID=UPI003EBC1BAF
MTGNQTVRIGIIGLGGIGRVHADHLGALASTEGIAAELAGGMDISPDARRTFAQEYGVETVSEAEALYERVDAVIVTTPNRFHEEYVVGALDAGLDVLVEKPLAHTLESAERIAEAAERSDQICMVGFHNRFAPRVQVLKEAVDSGRFGSVTHVDATYVRRRGIPGRGSWFTDEAVAGGGALIDIGAHAIDLALYFMNFPEIVEVSGVARSSFGVNEEYTYLEMWGEDGDGEFTVDDSANAMLRCADGQTIVLDTAWASNRPSENTYRVRGTEAGADLDRKEDELTIYEVGDAGGPHFSDATITTRQQSAHRNEQRAFLHAVSSGEEPGTNTVEEALTVQRVLEAIYESSETGEAVSFRESPPLTRGD